MSPDPPPESAASDGVRHPPESSPVDGADHSTHQVCRPRPWEMLVYLIHICAGITPKVSGFVNKRMKFAIDDYQQQQPSRCQQQQPSHCRDLCYKDC